jgi:hypothetical protein
VLPAGEAEAALGAAGCSALRCALEAVRQPQAECAGGGRGVSSALPPQLVLPPLARGAVVYVLRRTAARGKWINFHYDSAGLTAQVPLDGSGASVGGQTLYALPCGQLLAPRRVFGRAVAHHGDVAHGVTRLLQGTRYGLYALAAREDAGLRQQRGATGPGAAEAPGQQVGVELAWD